MIDDFAVRIRTAYAWTRISAVLIEASQVTFAISINNTLGFATVYVRIANEWRYACAFSYTVDRRTNGVLAAG